MDPNILLESFSPDDMEIWQSYNLFTDETINSSSSIKDQIKEENTGKKKLRYELFNFFLIILILKIDMMDNIFTSICPNDLMNPCHYNQDQQQHQIQYDYIRNNSNNNNIKEYNSGEEYYSSSPSSSSSSSSLSNHPTDVLPQHQQVHAINLDTVSFIPCNNNNGDEILDDELLDDDEEEEDEVISLTINLVEIDNSRN